MSEPPLTSYDAIPYNSKPYAQTHPDRLASVAALLRLEPPDPRRCRVLELGCAAGGNLIPLALAAPESSFLGIDLSRRQVADGQETIQKLALPNIELKHMSILEVTPEMGTFDYVLCHGVYSWVPGEVQDKILRICAENLAANGIAYVSYNTLPGWHMRGMIRDMMRYHANRFPDPEVRIRQARNLLEFLAKSVGQDVTPYSLLLKSEVELLSECEDAYLFHEHLEECNAPVYFHEFVQRAAEKGLRYLAEADFNVMAPGNYPAEVQDTLHRISPDIIHLEQFMDFLRNRMFRQTLLCHHTQKPVYGLRPEQLGRFAIASSARPTAVQPDLHSDTEEEFCNLAGIRIAVRLPIAKAALVCLGESWPRPVPFDHLVHLARARLTPEQPDVTAEDVHNLGHTLLKCYISAASRLVELWLHPPEMMLDVSERPAVTSLARLQASRSRRVTNVRHEGVDLDNFGRHIVSLLDGQRDRPALVEALLQRVLEGQLTVRENEEPVHDPERLRVILDEALIQVLPRLARLGLLVG
jgi:methyltransferase-like protein/2-polyprenyl-3-methyl-5-hydroxy-6-metoxy-1,4-benzoquinol methylase